MFTAIATAVLFASQPAHADPGTPDTPPIVLTIDGVQHPVHDGQPTTITIDGKPYEIRVDLPTIARFVGKLIRFDYPSSFAVSLNEERGSYTAWRITAGDAEATIYEFNGELALDAFFDNITSQYVDTETDHVVGEVALKTRTTTLDGRSLLVDVAGVSVYQEIYAVASDSVSTFLVFQDGRTDASTPTTAFAELMSKVAKTFSTKDL